MDREYLDARSVTRETRGNWRAKHAAGAIDMEEKREKVYVHRARCATYHHHAVRIHNTLTRTKECPYRYWQIKLNHEILSSFNGEFQAHCGTASSIGGSPLWWRWQTSGQTKGDSAFGFVSRSNHISLQIAVSKPPHKARQEFA